MKGKSLRFRINLWYTILMCVVSTALIACIVVTARTTEKAQAQQNLIRSVERNIDEIEVENGILDIESDFAYVSGGVYALVFDSKGNILGGNYPEGFTTESELKNGRFALEGDYYIYDSKIEFLKYEYKIHGITGEILSSECDGLDSYTPFSGDTDVTGEGCSLTYEDAYRIALNHSGIPKENTELMMARSYIYNDDRLYEIEFYCPDKGYEDIWIRGVTSATDSGGVWGTIAKLATILIPLVVILAATVGSILSKKALSPISRLSEEVSKTHSGNDLTKRIELTDSDKNIITLTKNINAMFERLQSSFESEKQFSSDVSHELRTPVSVIIAECEYQLSRTNIDKETAESYKTLKKQALNIRDIISQLLYFSSIDQGRRKAELVNESLSELVLAVCEDMEQIKGKEILLTKEIEPDIYLPIDVAMITRLVSNLISNAFIYSEGNGRVKVTLKKDEKSVLLHVEDNGIGIAKEHLDKIWNRFYRVDKSRSRNEGCSGLGLAMVKQIAELHGAAVSVESEPGKGSTFTVEFKT